MAVDPKETNWCCRAGRAVGWVVQGLRDSPSLEDLRISDAANRQLQERRPAPLVLFFHDAPAKAQA